MSFDDNMVNYFLSAAIGFLTIFFCSPTHPVKGFMGRKTRFSLWKLNCYKLQYHNL